MKKCSVRVYAPHLSTSCALVLPPPRVCGPTEARVTREGERITAGGPSSREGSSVSLEGASNSLKMQHARRGVGERRRGERRRDEQVSAEKWVSRTGVSAGEYHIATLRRGLRRALRVEGWHILAHTHIYTRAGVYGGWHGATV